MQTQQRGDGGQGGVATRGGADRDHHAAPLPAREGARLDALARLDAVRPDADHALQEIADDARALFGTALCLINLITADMQYFRAWSGDLPAEIVRARQIPREQSMCRHVVTTGSTLVVPDLGADERFPGELTFHHFGMRFYAGAPLVTSDGHTVGSLCLLDPDPRTFDVSQLTTLAAFARAAIGRLEALATLGRERAAGQDKDALLAALRAASQEEALRHVTELNRVLTLAHDLIAIIGYDGIIRRINPACLLILGYHPDELLGGPVNALIHPDDREATFASRGTDVRAFTNRWLRRDGTPVWLEWQATPVPGDAVMYCVARDITARKAAEEALRSSEATLRAAQRIAGLGSWATDLASGESVWSDEMYRLHGVAPGAFLPNLDTILPLVHPDDRALVRGWIMGELDEHAITHRIVRADGEERTVQGQYEILRDEDGQATSLIGTLLDITARKAVEGALADALRDHEQIMEAVPDIIYRLDLDGHLVAWNRRMEGVTGYRPDELADRDVLAFFPPPEQPRIAAAIRTALERGFVEVEGNFLRKDGSLVPYQWTSSPMRDGQGDLIGLTGVGRDISARAAAEAALRASEARNAAILDVTPDILLLLSRDGVYRDFRSPHERSASPARDYYVGHHLRERHTPEFTALMLRRIVATLDTGVMQVFEYFLDTPSGRAEFEARLVPSGPDEVLGIVRNITEQKRAERARRRSEEHARAIIDAAFDAIVTMGTDGLIRSLNPAAERIFGHAAADAIGQPMAILMPEQFRDTHNGGMRRYLATGQAPILGQVLEVQGRRADGAHFPLELIVTAVHGEGELFFTGMMRDIGERKAFAARLEHQAFHDALTGLPNRARFLDRLEQALGRAGGDRGRIAALLLDLDQFKVVNDSLGHAVGDELLIAVAARLRAALRARDVVARLGGDEFAILLDPVADVDEAGRIADDLLGALAAPLALAGREFVIGGSIGVATGDAAESTADLLRAADLALYRAKDGGKGRHAIFDDGLHAAASARLALEAELRRALAEGEFLLHYQPQIDLATGRITGVEALVRWAHPARGLVPPGDFIPLAEETGLIVPLGHWVLETACRQARAWAEERPADPPPTMGVNLSARQLLQPDLAGEVAGILRETGVDPALIQLELTESMLMEDATASLAMLERLRALGVRLALDDFGTGYSSLAYLKRFPVDVLKVDKAFVSGLGRERADAAIAGAVITLAHALGMTVTAEGIETAEEAALLRALGCESGQGYHFARPLPPAALADRLARRGAAHG